MPRPHHSQLIETNRLSAAGMRSIPVGRLTRLAILAALHKPTRRKPQRRAEPPSLDEWASLYADTGAIDRRRPRRLDDNHFREVAEIYRRAKHDGLDPVMQVQSALPTSRSTAGRWVVEARRRGFLGPTTKGKAGELRPPKASRTGKKPRGRNR